MKKILVLPAVFLLAGCLNVNDFLIQRTLKPETAKEYRVKGTFVYFTSDIDAESTVNGIVVMFRNAPDFYALVNGGIEGFALDLPTNCTGISRIGLRYSDFGSQKEYWINDSYGFTLQTNRINYLGRFVFQLPVAYDLKLGVRVSNVIEKDKPRFAEGYTNQTNLPFIHTELKKDTVR